MTTIKINNIDNQPATLPLNCEAYYWDDFLSSKSAIKLFNEIRASYPVCNKRIMMSDGSEHISETGSYLFTDTNLTSFDSIPEVWGGRSSWTNSLSMIRDKINVMTGVHFHVARCVFYQDGNDGMGFHRDLPAYGSTSHIASLSLGAEREFVFRRIADPKEHYSIILSSGSLLFMGKGCQDLYEHALPKNQICNSARLNLTFRKYGWD